MMWMENGKNKLLPKTKGTSIMVSGFCCDCCGFFSDESQRSFKLFEAGKNREGWFTNKDLVEQFEDLVPLIKRLHADCDIVIAFDNSMTHHAKVPDGLDVGNLKMSDGMSSHTKVKMKAGWYYSGSGEIVVQSMQFADGIQKGVKTILTERGKHKNALGNDLILQCKPCREKVSDESRQEGIANGNILPLCCASFVLSHEQDFLEQEEWLTEVVKKAGFEIIFYPKYHCELNYIEMVWGWTKSFHRRTCTYNYKDLKERLPITLSTTLPIANFRLFSRYCLRFMIGYKEGLQGPLLDFTMKKYKSHRSIPSGVKTLLEADYKKYLDIKKERKNKN